MPTPVRPGFGRLIAPDKRDKRFAMRALLAVEPPGPPKVWSLYRKYQLQQEGGTCVGHGWAHFLAASPHLHPVAHPIAYEIYARAQQADEWADTPPAEGTSVRAGAKACVDMGLIEGSYVWAWTEKEVRRWTGRSPVVIGVSWLTGMMQVDGKGYIHAIGGEEGGHCVCLLGYSVSRDAYRIAQSWNPDWGENGRAWISSADVKLLIENLGGEACAAEELVKPKAASKIFAQLEAASV